MKIAVGADHAGFDLKDTLKGALDEQGHEVIDLGTFDPSQPDDYPDYALAVGRALQEGRAERGILICGSGVGISVAANKIPGVRAGLCHDTYSAHQGVEHDRMNLLVLGSRIVASELARDLVRIYLGARFSGDARHVRRLDKLRETLEAHKAQVRVGSFDDEAIARRLADPLARNVFTHRAGFGPFKVAYSFASTPPPEIAGQSPEFRQGALKAWVL